MSFVSRLTAAAACAAGLLASAAVAHADNVISGTVWSNQAAYPSALAAPVGPANGTFTTNEINFNSNGATDYTISSFLASGGANIQSPTYTDGTLNNTIFEFTGSTYLTAGTVYSVTHDDGATLYLDGGTTNVLPAGSENPTSSEVSDFSVATSGNYTFVLDYAEVNGAPAVLSAPFAATAATPEPSGIALLGTSLLGMAGVVRRRLQK